MEDFFPCNIHNRHPPLFTIGGKRSISPPKGFEGTAYRGTGSTNDSIAQGTTDCKQKNQNESHNNVVFSPFAMKFSPCCRLKKEIQENWQSKAALPSGPVRNWRTWGPLPRSPRRRRRRSGRRESGRTIGTSAARWAFFAGFPGWKCPAPGEC